MRVLSKTSSCSGRGGGVHRGGVVCRYRKPVHAPPSPFLTVCPYSAGYTKPLCGRNETKPEGKFGGCAVCQVWPFTAHPNAQVSYLRFHGAFCVVVSLFVSFYMFTSRDVLSPRLRLPACWDAAPRGNRRPRVYWDVAIGGVASMLTHGCQSDSRLIVDQSCTIQE